MGRFLPCLAAAGLSLVVACAPKEEPQCPGGDIYRGVIAADTVYDAVPASFGQFYKIALETSGETPGQQIFRIFHFLGTDQELDSLNREYNPGDVVRICSRPIIFSADGTHILLPSDMQKITLDTSKTS